MVGHVASLIDPLSLGGSSMTTRWPVTLGLNRARRRVGLGHVVRQSSRPGGKVVLMRGKICFHARGVL
jgi:hypothetical protein